MTQQLLSEPEAVLINLAIEPESSGVFVSSKDLPGLYILGKCLHDLKPILEAAIIRLLKDNHGKTVKVHWISDHALTTPYPSDDAKEYKVPIKPVHKQVVAIPMAA